MTASSLRFDGEVVVVAGGGGSLGSSYARLFGARGAKVVVNDVEDSAREVARQINDAGGIAVASVGDSVTMAQQIIDEAIANFGRIDIVVNSSGMQDGGLFHEMPIEAWNRMFDSHFTSTLMLARAAWPHLVASGNGRLITTASTATYGLPYGSTYVAAKAATIYASRCWAMEGAMQNVRVNTVLPTAMSRMARNIPDPAQVKIMEDNFQPELVAGFVAYLAHRDNRINGMAFEVGGGRAAPVYQAQAAPVIVDRSAEPEIWLGQEEGLLSRDIQIVPESMMEEYSHRLVSLGLLDAEAVEKSKQDVWAPAQ